MIYGQVGAAVEHLGPAPFSPPVGRVLQFQAPLAGQQLHTALSVLPAYKRVTEMQGNAVIESVASLLLAPVLAGIMASNENAARTLFPIFASAIRASAVEVVKMQRTQNRAMDEVDEYAAEADALMGEFMAAMFEPREPTEAQADATI
jgi:hypothetical protein